MYTYHFSAAIHSSYNILYSCYSIACACLILYLRRNPSLFKSHTHFRFKALLRPNTISTREISKLCIVGLELDPYVTSVRPTTWTDESPDFPYVTSCIAYIALATHHMAMYLGIPLRYPIRYFSSRSFILDPSPSLNLPTK